MRRLGALGILLAGPALGAPEGGEAVIARARAFEAGQVRALAAQPVELHTHGFVNDGKTTRVIDSFRRLLYHADGAVTNQFQSGQLDGKPVSEGELRKAMGAEDKTNEHGEVLGWALAPLSSPDMEVTAVGPAPSGGYTLRCRVKKDAMVSAVVLVVDEKTGRKRSASIEIGGMRARLADRLENVLAYADDGAPVEFHASFHFKLGWIERSADFRSKRIAAPSSVAKR